MKRNVQNEVYHATNGKKYKVVDLISTLIDLATNKYKASERKKLAQGAIGWANYLQPSPKKAQILSTLFKMLNQVSRKDAQKMIDDARYDKIKNMINENGGRFVTVQFVKKDGSIRRMQVQPAALKMHVKGEAASDQAKRATATRKKNNPHLMSVFDVQKGAIRSINLDTVQEIAMKGKTFDLRTQ